MVILNPNCSEVVWRLDIPIDTKKAIIRSLEDKDGGGECRTSTDSYPNGCVDDILDLAEGIGNLEDYSIDIIENNGGGGSCEYIEECFEIVKKVEKGEITKEEAYKMEEGVWG